MFEEIALQLEEMGEGTTPAQSGLTEKTTTNMADSETERELLRNKRMGTAALADPTFSMTVNSSGFDNSRALTFYYGNLRSPAITVKLYFVDLELLFSTEPFSEQAADRFSYIQPNIQYNVPVPPNTSQLVLPAPKELSNKNAFIECSVDGISRTAPFFSHSLRVQLMESNGHLCVSSAQTGAPLPKTYIKVYARMRNGPETFYKDGYTDLRGRFDYASLSTDDLDRTERFALLVMSKELGACVKEARPPQQ